MGLWGLLSHLFYKKSSRSRSHVIWTSWLISSRTTYKGAKIWRGTVIAGTPRSTIHLEVYQRVLRASFSHDNRLWLLEILPCVARTLSCCFLFASSRESNKFYSIGILDRFTSRSDYDFVQVKKSSMFTDRWKSGSDVYLLLAPDSFFSRSFRGYLVASFIRARRRGHTYLYRVFYPFGLPRPVRSALSIRLDVIVISNETVAIAEPFLDLFSVTK